MAKRTTKVNEVSQIRPGMPGDILITSKKGVKWASNDEANIAKQTELDAYVSDIDDLLMDRYTKAEVDNIIASINTAKFEGPFTTIDEVAQPYDSNNLYLVGESAPYIIYALIGEELRIIGNTGTDLTKYFLKEDALEALSGKVDKVPGKGLTEAEFTNAEKRKLFNIHDGAEPNIIFTVNGKTGTVELTGADINISNSLDKTLGAFATETTSDITNLKSGKVDKDGDKVLSTNDFTNEHKTKLESLKQGLDGIDGEKGERGYSAYEIALQNGYDGTHEEWLEYIKGAKGDTGARGATGPEGPQGIPGVNGTPGAPGAPGADAKQVELQNDNTDIQWRRVGETWNNLVSVASLKGDKGDKGDTGAPGIAGTTGHDGVNGKSAYELALDNGYVGSLSLWLASLKGANGDTGPQGPPGDVGNITYSQISGIPDLSIYALRSDLYTTDGNLARVELEANNRLGTVEGRITALESRPTIPEGVVTDTNFNSKARVVPLLNITPTTGDATLVLTNALTPASPLSIANLASNGSGLFKIGATNVFALTASLATFYRPIAMSNQKITGLGAPTAATDASTKAYVDNLAATKANSATTYNKTEVDNLITTRLAAFDISSKLDVSKYRENITETPTSTTFTFGSKGPEFKFNLSESSKLSLLGALNGSYSPSFQVGSFSNTGNVIDGIAGFRADTTSMKLYSGDTIFSVENTASGPRVVMNDETAVAFNKALGEEVYGTTNYVYNADDITKSPSSFYLNFSTAHSYALVRAYRGLDVSGPSIFYDASNHPTPQEFCTLSMERPRYMFAETGITFSFMSGYSINNRNKPDSIEKSLFRAIIRIDYNDGSSTRAEKDFTVTDSGQAILHIGSEFFSGSKYSDSTKDGYLKISVVANDGYENSCILSSFCLYEGIIKNPEYRPPVKFLSPLDYNPNNTPIQPLPIYGMVRGRIGGAAQVMQARVTVDMQWDESRKIEQNIQFLGGGAGSNAWLIPEDGIYTLTASAESVDVPNPFALFFQRKDTNGVWAELSPEGYNSYPANGRGMLISTTQHLRKGELVNVRVVNGSDGPTRIGEHDHRGNRQCYYTITRVATFGMNTSVSARPYNRLVKKVNARINIAGGTNNSIKFSFDLPEEFKDRKFKATFKLIYDYQNLNNTDRPRAVTEVFRKDWVGQSYILDKKLFNKHSNGFHNYFELTEVYENTSELRVLDIVLRDRDNTSPTQSASTDSAVILETID